MPGVGIHDRAFVGWGCLGASGVLCRSRRQGMSRHEALAPRLIAANESTAMPPKAHMPGGPLWRALLAFVLPMMAQNILQSLAITISAIIVGRGLGIGHLAAMATFMPVVFFFIAFLIGLTAGASVLVGQAAGAGRPGLIRRIAGTTTTATLILGILLAVMGEWLAPQIMDILGVPPDIRAPAEDYARAMFMVIPVMFTFIMTGALLRGMRDTLRPLLMQIISTVLAAILTLWFVMGTPMGVKGAAWAQGISQLVALAALSFWLRSRRRHPLAPNAMFLHAMRPDPVLLRKILHLGVPTGVQIVAGSASALVIVGLVNAFGSDATAAYGAVSQVVAYVQFPALSIAIAASIFGAQMIGAGRQDRLDEVVRTALIMNLVLTGSLVALVLITAGPVVALFLTDPEVIALGRRLLHIVTWASLMFGAGTIFSGVMRASGTVLMPMVISIGCILMVELPVAVLLSRKIGLEGVWWGYVFNFAMLMLLQGAWFMLVWRRKKVVALI